MPGLAVPASGARSQNLLDAERPDHSAITHLSSNTDIPTQNVQSICTWTTARAFSSTGRLFPCGGIVQTGTAVPGGITTHKPDSCQNNPHHHPSESDAFLGYLKIEARQKGVKSGYMWVSFLFFSVVKARVNTRETHCSCSNSMFN